MFVVFPISTDRFVGRSVQVYNLQYMILSYTHQIMMIMNDRMTAAGVSVRKKCQTTHLDPPSQLGFYILNHDVDFSPLGNGYLEES